MDSTSTTTPPPVTATPKESGKDMFIDAVFLSNNQVVIVLLAHRVIEYYLNAILTMLFPNPDFILDEDARFSFAAKLRILKATGKVPHNAEAEMVCASKLNNLRDSCAHSPGYEVTPKDIDILGTPLGSRYRSICERWKSDYTNVLRFVLIPLVVSFEAQYNMLAPRPQVNVPPAEIKQP